MVWVNVRKDNISDSTGYFDTTLPISITTQIFKAIETTTRIALNGVAYDSNPSRIGWYRWGQSASVECGFRLFVIGK